MTFFAFSKWVGGLKAKSKTRKSEALLILKISMSLIPARTKITSAEGLKYSF